MFGRSLKYQLAILSALFVVFVAAVLFQMYFTHKLQYEEILELQQSHKIIGGFLDLEDRERSILDGLRATANTPQSDLRVEDLAEMDRVVREWFENLKNWKRELSKWQSAADTALKLTIFDDTYLAEKKRQYELYRKALVLCKDGKSADAAHLLNIESAFLFGAKKTITIILDNIKSRIEHDRNIIQRFYFSTAFAVLLSLVVLSFVSLNIITNITRGIKSLEAGARRVSAGDLSQPVKTVGMTDMQSLAKAFNEMQAAIKARDSKINETSAEIKKLNEELEKKVMDRNKTIINQNTALKRKNEELEQVLYAASHDLRTPLISIQGFSEELKSSCERMSEKISASRPDVKEANKIISEEVNVAIGYILKGSKRMELLIDALLRLSRMGRESLKIQKINMDQLLKSVMDNLSFQINEIGGASFQVAELQECSADPSMMEQIFTNFVTNAIKYRDQSRPLSVKIYSDSDKDFVRYYVADNGIGIAQDNLEKVFHAFFRVDDEAVPGDGVGLSIVNRAADLHNGRAWAESEPGKGSVFAIELPRQV